MALQDMDPTTKEFVVSNWIQNGSSIAFENPEEGAEWSDLLSSKHNEDLDLSLTATFDIQPCSSPCESWDSGISDNSASGGSSMDSDTASDPDYLPERPTKSKAIKPRKSTKKPNKSIVAFQDEDNRTPVIPRAKLTCWLLKLLQSKYHNPRVVRWIEKSKGLFRIIDQKELARLWGESKRGNSEMTYEKFRYTLRSITPLNSEMLVELISVRARLATTLVNQSF